MTKDNGGVQTQDLQAEIDDDHHRYDRQYSILERDPVNLGTIFEIKSCEGRDVMAKGETNLVV